MSPAMALPDLNWNQPILEFFAPGIPRPQGSLAIGKTRQGKLFLRHSTAQGDRETWAKTVATCARASMLRADVRLIQEGGLLGILTFLRLRPKGHFDHNGFIRPACKRLLPETKPDYDKLARTVGDALTGVLYRDDSQWTTVLIRKRFSDAAGCHVKIWFDLSEADVTVPPIGP
jgi:Endodeoxyribonuclease RusA